MQVDEALKTGITFMSDLARRADAATDDQEKESLLVAAVHAGSYALNVANDIKVGKQDHLNLTEEGFRKQAIPENLAQVVNPPAASV